MDFVDDEHLAAAVMKNKQMLLGKKLSIARSNPKQRERESFVLNAPGGHGKSGDLNYTLSLLDPLLFLPFPFSVCLSLRTYSCLCNDAHTFLVIAADA